MIKFDSISYLAKGNDRQKDAYQVLKDSLIFEILQQFDPILVGTVPLNIAIKNSDLDIICCYQDKQKFRNLLIESFSLFKDFSLKETMINDQEVILAKLIAANWEIEIFGQQIPTREQAGYRHMLIEYKLLNERDESFRAEIIKLKEQGYKTEPAFARMLNLAGDPYLELLKL
ncbi:hypothetical protein HDF26_001055 [Pedobacter cryoconitis]|uniref:Diadenosine tetraphosphate hydrolase n=1 Tax=Pedobacter cryoconitis TaxID=188932 RepID=A0A7W8ZQR1_9SPHI|nr:DUF4269 domain-containing protein [Pedobacter cryoconitis]MBB5638442.1 hypothetical protein [Pedobacter cryoconitis]MBB6270628.1 hypothetical protein [Pedobacter cryoconitis]